MTDLLIIDSRKAVVRLLLAAAALTVLAFAWFAVRWQMGDLLASITQETDPNITEIAGTAVRWAPGDPAAHALKAAAGSETEAIASFEAAVARAPYDYRWRTELGRAYEQDEQFDRAEEQLKKAVELAPSYSAARWHLGNFYLRQEKADLAMTELKIAARNNISFREQVFSLVWDYSGRDPSAVASMAGEDRDLIARLAYFFAARGRSKESLENWNRLAEADKAKFSPVAAAIALGLFDQKHFSEALEFARQNGTETEASPDAITNPSFERPLTTDEGSRFGWRIIRNDSRFEAVIDNRVKREGTRSLRVGFKGYARAGLSNVLQTVVVTPGQRYTLRFFVRTENLRSAGLPMLEILNANDETTIARSIPFSSGTNDWNEYVLDITIPANCSGITIRTIRAFCGEDCPITGTFWYDDFELARKP